MRAVAVEISDLGVGKSARNVRISTQQAARAWARRRYHGRDVVKSAEAEFDLTNGEARGLASGTASQRTIDKILSHRNGGALVAIAIEATAWEISSRELLAHCIEIERGKIAHEQQQRVAEERRLVALADSLNARFGRDVLPPGV